MKEDKVNQMYHIQFLWCSLSFLNTIMEFTFSFRFFFDEKNIIQSYRLSFKLSKKYAGILFLTSKAYACHVSMNKCA